MFYKHVEHGMNQQADWLANVALHTSRTVAHVERLFPDLREEMAPPTTLDWVEGQPKGQAAVWETVVGDR